MKVDFLFTTWNCSECAMIKQKLNPDAMFNDDFAGKDGQALSVINAFSNTGTSAILKKFEFLDHVVSPAIYTHNNVMLFNLEDIISYLKEQGFLNVEEC